MSRLYRSMIAEMMHHTGDGGDTIEAYCARPLEDGPLPSMVLLHHAPAWDESSLEMVRKFAHHGIATISPHLYSREGGGTASPEDAAAAARGAGGASDQRVLGDAAGAIDWLRAQPWSNQKVGVIGFCSGGRQSFIAACRLPVDAAIDCWGGSVIVEPGQLSERQPVAAIDYAPDLSCPLLGIFGADDYNPSAAQVALISQRLTELAKVHEFHLFEDAGHSFFTVDEPNYRVQQSLAGWKKIFEFCGRHLG